MDTELSHCPQGGNGQEPGQMKTAATIDVTIPENRKLEPELPPEVPRSGSPSSW
jgi:hypothetical protein